MDPTEIIEFDGERLDVRIDRSLRATPTAISPFVDEAMRVIAGMGCAEGTEAEIELALREALANAIKHGSGSDPAKSVQCIVACDAAKGMLIIVRDSGPGFTAAQVADPVVGQNLFRHHGRGIYLINQLMDRVEFERGGTEIRMRKYSRPPEVAPRSTPLAEDPR
jgi:serine/threonine-protein kinase RsbW